MQRLKPWLILLAVVIVVVVAIRVGQDQTKTTVNTDSVCQELATAEDC